VIRDAEPLTDAVTYAFPSNLRRRFERLRRFPDGYLVTGDAICSFNPIYGQGMSVATLEGLALRDCLAKTRSLDEVWQPFFKAAARIIDTPWAIAAGSDFAFPGVTGPSRWAPTSSTGIWATSIARRRPIGSCAARSSPSRICCAGVDAVPPGRRGARGPRLRVARFERSCTASGSGRALTHERLNRTSPTTIEQPRTSSPLQRRHTIADTFGGFKTVSSGPITVTPTGVDAYLVFTVCGSHKS
jgi:hypothetical protein